MSLFGLLSRRITPLVGNNRHSLLRRVILSQALGATHEVVAGMTVLLIGFFNLNNLFLNCFLSPLLMDSDL